MHREEVLHAGATRSFNFPKRVNALEKTEDPPTPAERGAAKTWAQHLKRVVKTNAETYPVCEGAIQIIAFIEDPEVIEEFITHLDAKTEARSPEAATVPGGTASELVRRTHP